MIEQLARQLLVGTRRETAPVTAASPLTAEAFERFSSFTPEERLLASCAVAAAFESAAFLPEAKGPQASEPARDDRPLCSAGAARVLSSALSGSHRAVVAEWATAAAEVGVRPPSRTLPGLLELATSLRSARPATVTVAGARGRWLAEMNDAWRWLLAAGGAGSATADDSIWEQGGLEDRCEFLRGLRVRDPSSARERLGESLAGEKASTRARLVAELRTGLSDEDEPFLEALLDDKSLEVRRSVAALLSLLPASALSRRMVERLEGCVGFERKLLRRFLRVEPPGAADAAMSRDSIPDKAAGGLGARATILMRLVAHTPLTWWTDTGRCSPEEVLRLASGTEWTEALVRGLSEAAANQSRTDWIVALLGWTPPGKQLSVDRDLLLRAVPAADLEAVLAARLTPETLLDLRHLLKETDREARSWGEGLSDAFLAAARRAVVESSAPEWELRSVINAAGPRLHPARLDDALSSWPETYADWAPGGDRLAEFFEVIRLRRDLWKELSP